jgi:hypothetical protein
VESEGGIGCHGSFGDCCDMVEIKLCLPLTPNLTFVDVVRLTERQGVK